jgi:hypothetical protein
MEKHPQRTLSRPTEPGIDRSPALTTARNHSTLGPASMGLVGFERNGILVCNSRRLIRAWHDRRPSDGHTARSTTRRSRPHESPGTADRTSDELTLDEIERIVS